MVFLHTHYWKSCKEMVFGEPPSFQSKHLLSGAKVLDAFVERFLVQLVASSAHPGHFGSDPFPSLLISSCLKKGSLHFMLSPNPTARLQWHDELTTAQMERSDHVHRTRGEGLFVDLLWILALSMSSSNRLYKEFTIMVQIVQSRLSGNRASKWAEDWSKPDATEIGHIAEQPTQWVKLLSQLSRCLLESCHRLLRCFLEHYRESMESRSFWRATATEAFLLKSHA